MSRRFPFPSFRWSARPFCAIAPTAATQQYALPTVLPVVVLELGLLLARPDRGWMGVLTGPGLGGALARRLLPFTVLVPFAGLWLRQLAEQAHLVGKESAGSIYALIFVFVQSVPIMWYAVAVNRSDRKRAAAEEFVRALLRIGARLNSTLDLDALLAILATEAARLVGADSAVAGFRTAEGMTCQWHVRKGEPLSGESWRPPTEGLSRSAPHHADRQRANAAETDAPIDQKLRTPFDARSTLCARSWTRAANGSASSRFATRPGGSPRATRSSSSRSRNRRRAQSRMPWPTTTSAKPNKRLKAADRHKDEFLATLAHELRNPLAPLRNGVANHAAGGTQLGGGRAGPRHDGAAARPDGPAH